MTILLLVGVGVFVLACIAAVAVGLIGGRYLRRRAARHGLYQRQQHGLPSEQSSPYAAGRTPQSSPDPPSQPPLP
jgi:hypothetical protein